MLMNPVIIVQIIEKCIVFIGPRITAKLFFETKLSDSISGIPPNTTPANEEKKRGSAIIQII